MFYHIIMSLECQFISRFYSSALAACVRFASGTNPTVRFKFIRKDVRRPSQTFFEVMHFAEILSNLKHKTQLFYSEKQQIL